MDRGRPVAVEVAAAEMVTDVALPTAVMVAPAGMPLVMERFTAVAVVVAADEMVTDVALPTAVMVAPAGMEPPVMLAPTSAEVKFAVAEVTVVLEAVVTPSATFLALPPEILAPTSEATKLPVAELTAVLELVMPSAEVILPLPRYTAPTVWVPVVENAIGVVTVPEESATGEPVLVPSAMNCTLPVGVPVPAAGATVAVKFVATFICEGLVAEVTVVVLERRTPQVDWPKITSPRAVCPVACRWAALTVREPSALTICSLKVKVKLSVSDEPSLKYPLIEVFAAGLLPMAVVAMGF